MLLFSGGRLIDYWNLQTSLWYWKQLEHADILIPLSWYGILGSIQSPTLNNELKDTKTLHRAKVNCRVGLMILCGFIIHHCEQNISQYTLTVIWSIFNITTLLPFKDKSLHPQAKSNPLFTLAQRGTLLRQQEQLREEGFRQKHLSCRGAIRLGS